MVLTNLGTAHNLVIDNESLKNAIANNEPITVIFRSTALTDGNSDYNDYWFDGQKLS